MKSSKRDKIRIRIEAKPYLHLFEGGAHCIPERVEEYDKDMFIVFNQIRQTFELHSLQYPGDTFQTTFPYDEMDARAIRHIWDNDISVHGTDIFKRIEREEEEHKKKQDRDHRRFLQDFAKETQTLFAQDAWK